MFVPAKTPRAIVERIHQETMKALRAPGMPGKLAQHGVEPMPISPEAFDALIRDEIETNIALMKTAGIKPT
jgi:tripartite-type tricarboxylate transporter receptor subunit TctC